MMYRATPYRPGLFAGLIALSLTACSSGRTAPPPVTPSHGTAGAASRAAGLEVPVSEAYDRAVAMGTRTRTGAPGPRYWQQWADYKLEAELNPVSKRLMGKGSIAYYNRSPDTLREVYVQLLHNIFAPGSRHNTDVPWAVEGVELSRVAAQGQELKPDADREKPAYQVDGTIMRIRLPHPLPPGGSAAFDFAWRLR